MGVEQYYGLAKKPNYGLNYESMVAALAKMLPQSYNAKISAEGQKNQEEYYDQMANLSQQEAGQAKMNQMTQTGLGLAQVGTTLWGNSKNADLLTKMTGKEAEPGMVSKGFGYVKDAAKGAYDTAKGLGIDAYNYFAGNASTAETAAAGAYEGMGSLAYNADPLPMLESGLSLDIAESGPVIEGAVNTGGAAVASAAASGAGDIGTIGIGAADIAGLGMDAISSVLPYAGLYSLAKMGVSGIDAIIENNPGLKGTGLDVWNGSFENPLGTEAYYGKYLAEHGIGNPEFNQRVSTFLNPVGAVVSNLSNLQDVASNYYSVTDNDTANVAIAIATGGLCIIITVCTNPYSTEVNITREYRDKFMSTEQLRGYYIIAEKVVPLIVKYKWFKVFVKKHLVDNIVEYCTFKLNPKLRASKKAIWVTETFLSLCTFIGKRKKSFIRINGEVY